MTLCVLVQSRRQNDAHVFRRETTRGNREASKSQIVTCFFLIADDKCPFRMPPVAAITFSHLVFFLKALPVK